MPHDAAELAQLQGAISLALRAIENRDDPHAAYAAATAAGLLGRNLIDAAATARGRALTKIRDAEGLSIGQLATRMHMSKTRVQQLMNHDDEDPR